MSYKFQRGQSILSGSMILEGSFEGQGVNSIGAISGSGNLLVGGTVMLEGVADAAVAIAADSMYFLDADGLMKSERLTDYATAIAGDAITASGGALSVGVDDSTIEINSDALRLKDDGVTGAKLAPAVAGLGLAQDGSGNLDLDLNELVAETIASGDFLAFVDSTDNGTHKETIDDLATLFAGNGLSAASAVMALDLNELSAVAIASGDFLAIVDSTDNSTKKESIDDIATLFAGNGLSAASAVMAVDLNELSAAAIDVAADSFAIIDANDSNGSRKESIADFVTAMAGGGLNATSGVLSVQGNSVALKADGQALVEGYNYFADANANATVTLPASPSVGDVCIAKAANLTSGATIIINKGSADHRIDGEESVIIESPYGAISFVYVVADAWRIV